jgi:hypothetical protein
MYARDAETAGWAQALPAASTSQTRRPLCASNANSFAASDEPIYATPSRIDAPAATMSVSVSPPKTAYQGAFRRGRAERPYVSALSTVLPRARSGLMDAAVPRIMPAPVIIAGLGIVGDCVRFLRAGPALQDQERSFDV